MMTYNAYYDCSIGNLNDRPLAKLTDFGSSGSARNSEVLLPCPKENPNAVVPLVVQIGAYSNQCDATYFWRVKHELSNAAVNQNDAYCQSPKLWPHDLTSRLMRPWNRRFGVEILLRGDGYCSTSVEAGATKNQKHK